VVINTLEISDINEDIVKFLKFNIEMFHIVYRWQLIEKRLDISWRD